MRELSLGAEGCTLLSTLNIRRYNASASTTPSSPSPDLAPRWLRAQFVEDLPAIGPGHRHEAERRVAVVLLRTQAEAVRAGLVVDRLGIIGEIGPCRRRLVGIEPGLSEQGFVVEQKQCLVVRGNPVERPFRRPMLAQAQERLGKELAEGETEFFLGDFGTLIVANELRRPCNRDPRDIRFVARTPCNRELRQKVAITQDCWGELQILVLGRKVFLIEVGLCFFAQDRGRIRKVPCRKRAGDVLRSRARRQRRP